MEKSYQLKGLDCPNCAAKIETAVRKIDGVQKANVNFVQTKMEITYETVDSLQVEDQAKKIIHELEPDVEVIRMENHDKQSNPISEDKRLNRQLLRIGVSFVCLVALFLLSPAKPFDLIGYLLVYLLIGGDIVLRAGKNILRGQIFDENFLMTIATLGAMAIGEYPEAVAVMLFYQVGELFQSYAVGRSRKSITSLLDIRPDYATLVDDKGQETRVTPGEVQVEQRIIVKPGEKVPLDGRVVSGQGMVDTSALTGESVPRTVFPGEEILSGCINKDGVLIIQVEKSEQESTVNRILDLVENASSKKAPAENFITKFSRYYTPIVVGLAVLLAIIPPLLFQQSWNEWIYRSLTFLVISCPCALVVSVPLTFFGGIGGASRLGILVKGSNYLELLAHVDTVVFDKTGTLTKGVFEVQKVETRMDHQEFLQLTASAEQMSSHPIAQSILKANQRELFTVTELKELAGYGVSCKINGQEVVAGNDKLMKKLGIKISAPKDIGTIVYVAQSGKYLGYILIADEIKEDAAQTMEKLQQLGIRKTVMLTGDNQEIANVVAKKIGVSEVHAELLPEDKVTQLEKIMNSGHKTAFVGDGMNDAPVLARANLGIAMGALGSDSAIEAADVVIMNDQPSLIATAVGKARKTLGIVKQNIIFSISIKFIVLFLGAIGFASMGAAVFADVGVTVLAVLNAMRALRN